MIVKQTRKNIQNTRTLDEKTLQRRIQRCSRDDHFIRNRSTVRTQIDSLLQLYAYAFRCMFMLYFAFYKYRNVPTMGVGYNKHMLLFYDIIHEMLAPFESDLSFDTDRSRAFCMWTLAFCGGLFITSYSNNMSGFVLVCLFFFLQLCIRLRMEIVV